jgi:hypothetical protein
VIDLSTYGRPLNLEAPVVARVSREPVTAKAKRGIVALVTDAGPEKWGDLSGYRAVVTTQRLDGTSAASAGAPVPIIHSALQVSHLKRGDVIVAYPRTGYVRPSFDLTPGIMRCW